MLGTGIKFLSSCLWDAVQPFTLKPQVICVLGAVLDAKIFDGGKCDTFSFQTFILKATNNSHKTKLFWSDLRSYIFHSCANSLATINGKQKMEIPWSGLFIV